MNKYEIRTEKKKSAIVNVALKLFNEKGFVKTSIKEIASLANVSQVSIYNYFGSKEALVKECVYIVMNQVLQESKEILHEKIDFKEKLFKALSLCSNKVNASLHEYFSILALQDTAFLNLLFEGINEMKKDIYIDYINLGKEEGVINKTISNSTILEFIEAINGVGYKMNSEEIETKQEEMIKLFLYGIIGK